MAYRQTVTRERWETTAKQHEVFVSELVLDECGAGDPQAAAERIGLIQDLPALEIEEPARQLAAALLDAQAVPRTEPRDATHIAIAAIGAMYFLVTWNFKHILNPTKQALIAQVCRRAGYEPAMLSTPEQMTEGLDDP